MHSLHPTFHGYVDTKMDAILLMEACLLKILDPVNNRLNQSQRPLLKSGDCFIYIESQSNIKRWTEGLSWGPSRIVNDFLIYKQANKSRSMLLDTETSLIKKNISIDMDGQICHLISYYCISDLMNNTLQTPSTIHYLKSLTPRNHQTLTFRSSIYQKQNKYKRYNPKKNKSDDTDDFSPSINSVSHQSQHDWNSIISLDGKWDSNSKISEPDVSIIRTFEYPKLNSPKLFCDQKSDEYFYDLKIIDVIVPPLTFNLLSTFPDSYMRLPKRNDIPK